ncbi:60S ribosomal protein L18 [Trifolium repens]|nr:60S ribosomal protein L18 [Trifolium repens]
METWDITFSLPEKLALAWTKLFASTISLNSGTYNLMLFLIYLCLSLNNGFVFEVIRLFDLYFQLYHFLVWRTDSGFNKVILKHLFMSKVNKPPLSLSRLFCFMMGKEGKIGVVVGAVIYDIRVYEVPAMKVATLRFTETARARIEKAGGMSHLTFDQLALRAPLGQNTVCILMLLLSAYCNSRCYGFVEIAVLLLVGLFT